MIKQTLAAVTLSVISFFSTAAEPFTKAAFDTAIANKQPVLVDVFADWCPTCAKQKKVLNKYFQQNPDSPVKVLTVDFDDQKEWVTFFKAPRQSTFIGFKDGERTWFAVAETNEKRIFNQLKMLENK